MIRFKEFAVIIAICKSIVVFWFLYDLREFWLPVRSHSAAKLLNFS